MAKKLIKKLNDREIYAKFADYASVDENGDKISDRKVKSVSVSGRTMTVHKTDGEQEVPVVPVPDAAGLILKSGEDGAYEWCAAGTIIDDLQGLDDMDTEQKQAFIDTLLALPQSDGKTYKLTCRNGELAWVEDV